MQATSTSNQVGAPTELRVQFTLPVPLKGSEGIYVTIPPEVTPPDPRNVSCLGDGGVLPATPIRCAANGQYITVFLGTTSGIAVGQRVQVRIRYAMNPSSTKFTSEFQVQIRDKEGFMMAQSQLGNELAKFRVGSPATIKFGNLTALDPRQ